MMLRLLCLFAGLVATVSGACDNGFKQLGEGCYLFSAEIDLSLTWSSARQYCHTLGADVDLAVFDNLCDDYQHVANYLLIADAFASLPAMYVGATGSDASWLWVDGRSLSVSSTFWQYSEPDAEAGCVYMYQYTYGGYERIKLFEAACSYERPFICQKNVIARI